MILIQKKISDPKRVRSDPNKKYRIEIRNDLIQRNYIISKIG